MLAFSLLISFLFITSTSSYEKVPEEIRPFIKNGHDVLDYKIGDINNDQLSDVVLILKDTNETSGIIGFPRPVILLVRDHKGHLKKIKENNKVVFQTDEGGIYGEPYSHIGIKNNSFTFFHYGGSSTRWKKNITFKLQEDEWILSEVRNRVFELADPELSDSSRVQVLDTIRNSNQFGIVKFANYNIYKL